VNVSLKIVHLSLRPVAVVLCLVKFDPLDSPRGSPGSVFLRLAQFPAVPIDLALVPLRSGLHPKPPKCQFTEALLDKLRGGVSGKRRWLAFAMSPFLLATLRPAFPRPSMADAPFAPAGLSAPGLPP